MPSLMSHILVPAALLFFMGCQSSSKSSVEPEPLASQVPPTSIAEPAQKPCKDMSFCTREYLPTICQFQGQAFEASNPCEARKLAQQFACEKALPFADAAVQCQGKKDAKPTASKNCGKRRFCTREFIPHNCAFGGKNFEGGNRCEALQKARTFACEKGLTFDEQTVSCEATQGKGERSR